LAMTTSPPMAVHSVDKANVLATSRLWRKVVTDLFAKEFPQLALDHHLVDSAAMLICSNPKKLNGIVLSQLYLVLVFINSRLMKACSDQTCFHDSRKPLWRCSQ
jgi:isocitrate/isopropylmalate dehydrogenase